MKQFMMKFPKPPIRKRFVRAVIVRENGPFSRSGVIFSLENKSFCP
jgi:hypothetical protein